MHHHALRGREVDAHASRSGSATRLKCISISPGRTPGPGTLAYKQKSAARGSPLAAIGFAFNRICSLPVLPPVRREFRRSVATAFHSRAEAAGRTLHHRPAGSAVHPGEGLAHRPGPMAHDPATTGAYQVLDAAELAVCFQLLPSASACCEWRAGSAHSPSPVRHAPARSCRSGRGNALVRPDPLSSTVPVRVLLLQRALGLITFLMLLQGVVHCFALCVRRGWLGCFGWVVPQCPCSPIARSMGGRYTVRPQDRINSTRIRDYPAQTWCRHEDGSNRQTQLQAPCQFHLFLLTLCQGIISQKVVPRILLFRFVVVHHVGQRLRRHRQQALIVSFAAFSSRSCLCWSAARCAALIVPLRCDDSVSSVRH